MGRKPNSSSSTTEPTTTTEQEQEPTIMSTTTTIPLDDADMALISAAAEHHADAEQEPTEPTTEQPEPEQDDAAEPTEPEQDPAVLVDAFATAWATAIDAADDATGTVPDAPLAHVIDAHRAIPRGLRADAVTTAFDATADAAEQQGSFAMIRAARSLRDGIAAAKPQRARTEPTDPRAAAANALASLLLATDAVTSAFGDDDAIAIRVAADERVAALRHAQVMPGDVVGSLALLADPLLTRSERVYRAANGRSTRSTSSTTTGAPRDAKQHSTGAGAQHVLAVLAAHPAGTMLTASQVAKQPSDIYDGVTRPLPSQGHIGSNVFRRPPVGTRVLRNSAGTLVITLADAADEQDGADDAAD